MSYTFGNNLSGIELYSTPTKIFEYSTEGSASFSEFKRNDKDMVLVDEKNYNRMIFNNTVMLIALDKVLKESIPEIIIEMNSEKYSVCITEVNNKKGIGIFKLGNE